MPKLTPAQMKKAVEEFKSKFTGGFYHGSASPKIKAFDPAHPASEFGSGADAAGEKFANATFLTKDPSFASSFLPTGNAYGYKPGSTIYPVSANLGKHFDYETPEGHEVINLAIGADAGLTPVVRTNNPIVDANPINNNISALDKAIVKHYFNRVSRQYEWE